MFIEQLSGPRMPIFVIKDKTRRFNYYCNDDVRDDQSRETISS